MERIGFIDITRDPKLYVVEKRRGRLELKDVKGLIYTGDYEISIPDPLDDIVEFYLSLPVSELNLRLMELPFSEKEKIIDVIPFELEGIILNDVKGIIFDAIILKRDERSTVLVVYKEKTILSRIIERLRISGIDPKVITSIELRHLLKDFHPESLLSPFEINEEERIGLAINELEDGTINLRRGELSYTKDIERTKRSLRWAAIFGILIIVFFVSSVVLKIVVAKKETSALFNDINNVYSEVFPQEKEAIPTLYRLKSHLNELREKERNLIGISPLNFLLELSRIPRGGITFNEITMDRGKIILKGEAGSFTDIQQMRDTLGGILTDIDISDSKALTGGKVSFTITAMEKKN